MYWIKKFRNGSLWKEERIKNAERARKLAKEWEAAGFDVEMGQIADSPTTGLHPTAMNAGDPGVRSSIRAEASWGESNDLDEQFWNRDA